MKRCMGCGAQFDDALNFCPQCGGELMAERVCEPPAVQKKESIVPILMTFISKVLAAVSFFIGAIAVVTASVDVWSGYYDYYGYLDFDFDTVSFSLIFAIAALVCAIVGFIFTLIKKPTKEKLFNSIAYLVVTVLLFILACVLMSEA